ncbi:NepR family anti-sigma factor [Methylobrevis pamukkalensis]
MYDEVVQQPVPDRFLDLLAKLDADVNAQRSKKDGE